MGKYLILFFMAVFVGSIALFANDVHKRSPKVKYHAAFCLGQLVTVRAGSLEGQVLGFQYFRSGRVNYYEVKYYPFRKGHGPIAIANSSSSFFSSTSTAEMLKVGRFKGYELKARKGSGQ